MDILSLFDLLPVLCSIVRLQLQQAWVPGKRNFSLIGDTLFTADRTVVVCQKRLITEPQ